MIFKHTLFLVALATSSSAYSANWQTLKVPGYVGNNIFQLDRASILKRGAVVQAWTRVIHPERFSVDSDSVLTARVVLELREINCSQRTETSKRVFFVYDLNDSTVMKERGPREPEDIVPGSGGEVVFAAVCRSTSGKRSAIR